MGKSLAWFGTLALATALAGPLTAAERDLYFSEALFWAHQGQYFEALERLDSEIGQHRRLDEPSLDSLYPFIDDAEFSVGQTGHAGVCRRTAVHQQLIELQLP